MKHSILAIIGLIALAIGHNRASAQTVETQTIGSVTVKWASASLPREDNTGLKQGVSWTQAETNWMQAVRTDVSSVGDGRAQVKKITYNDYEGMVVTDFTSWRSVVESSSEYGNRQHYGFKLYTSNGSTFIPSAISYSIVTQQWLAGSQTWVNYTTNTASMAIDNNLFRQRLETNNQPSTSQVMSTPTSRFVYGGYGVGFSPYGSGTPQDQTNNTLNFMRSYHLRTVLTLTVNVSGVAQPVVFTNIYMQDVPELKVNYVPAVGTTSASINWIGNSWLSYTVEKSPDFVIWSTAGHVSNISGFISLPMSEESHIPRPARFFYRVHTIYN